MNKEIFSYTPTPVVPAPEWPRMNRILSSSFRLGWFSMIMILISLPSNEKGAHGVLATICFILAIGFSIADVVFCIKKRNEAI